MRRPLARAVLLGALAARALRPRCSVLDFGALGDNSTEDTAAAAAAIAACATVVFPAPRTYLLRPVKLDAHDNLTLVVEPGATLAAWRDVDTWNTTPGVRALLWSDGFRACGQGAHLCAAPLAGFTLTGGGTVDGAGALWWPFGKTRARPMLVDVARAERLLISDVTLLASPSFHIQVRGADMEIARVTIRAGGCHGWLGAPNTDGINIGGQRIHVHDCFVHNGDDCVPTNVGWNGSDTHDVLVERVVCECGTNGGVPIIAGAGTVRDILYRDMIVRATNQGAGAKISEAYEAPSGSMVNVTWRNITIEQPRNAAIYTNLFQEDAARAQCFVPINTSRPAHWLTAQNFSFESIRATINSSAGAYAGCFACAPSRPCGGFAFDDVVVVDVAPAPQPAAPSYVCDNVAFAASASSPAPCGAGAAAAPPRVSGGAPVHAPFASTPTLDGVVRAAEWADATLLSADISGWFARFAPIEPPAGGAPPDLDVAAWVKHDGARLYLAFNVSDDLLYRVQTPAWEPARNSVAFVAADNTSLTRAQWPWFGDALEVLLNARGAPAPGATPAGAVGSWQLVVNSGKSRLGGVGVAGLLEGEPRSSATAWDTYSDWIFSRAAQAGARAAPGANGSAWAAEVAFDLDLLAHWDGRAPLTVAFNIALQDTDLEATGGDYGLRHEMWYAGSEAVPPTTLESFAPLILDAFK